MNTDENPLLSIIIPVYNTGVFLDRCLTSVINQTYKNLEIIVVNDGSTDNSDEIIQRYADKDKRILYINNAQNAGLFQARLRGYEKASGSYIASLDSDDFTGTDYYRTMLCAALKSGADIVLSNMTTYYQSSGERYQRTYGNYAVRNIDLSGKNIARAYFDMDAEVSQWWFVWNKIYKKSLWDKCYPTLSLYQGHHIMLEDFIFGTVFMTNAAHVISDPCDSYYYVRHEAASTGKAGGAAKIKKNVEDIADALQFIDTYLTSSEAGPKSRIFLEKARSRWKTTWQKSVASSSATNAEKSEILGVLDEIPSESSPGKFDDKWNSFFYRELSIYNNSFTKIKNEILKESTKLICIELPDTIFGSLLEEDVFYQILRMEWEQKFEDDICDIIRCRKKYKTGFSIDQIYEQIKLVSSKNPELIDRVKTFELDLKKKYSFLRTEVYNLADFCRAVGKQVILLNDSEYPYVCGQFCADIPDLPIYNTFDYKESVFQILCGDYQCTSGEIVFIGSAAGQEQIKQNGHGIRCITILTTAALADKNYEIYKKKEEEAVKYIDFRTPGRKEITGLQAVSDCLSFQNPFKASVKNAAFKSDPYLIGAAAAGPHIMSVLGWLVNTAQNENISHICFLGKDVRLYAHCMDYVKSKCHIFTDIQIHPLSFTPEEIALEWILWNEDFDEDYANKMNITVAKLTAWLQKNGISTDSLEKALFQNGITSEETIRTRMVCSLLRICLEQESSAFHSLGRILKDKCALPDKCIIFSNACVNAESVVLHRYGKNKNIPAKLFWDSKEENTGCRFYYRKKNIIDYPIRTYINTKIFAERTDCFYGERFLIEGIEKGILSYLTAYTSYFRDIIQKFLPYYSAEDSVAFELFINFPADNDRLIFDCVEWIDYERKSKPPRLLSNIWWDKLNEAGLLKKAAAKITPQSGYAAKNSSNKPLNKPLNVYSAYYKCKEYPLDQLKKTERIFLYWIFDKNRLSYKAHKYALSRVLLLPVLSLSGRRKNSGIECLYIATSNYNLLCCLVHKIMYHPNEPCDLALSIWRKDKTAALKSEMFFEHIYLMDDNHFRNMTWALDKEIENASNKETDYLVEGFYDKFYEELPFCLLEYKKIVATNTIMPITVLLQKLHLRYDCMEEAAGLYSDNHLLMNNMKHFHPKSEIYALEKYKMLNMDHVKGKRFVNLDAQTGKYSQKNVVDFNVVRNLKSLDIHTRQKILHVFSAKEAEKGEERPTCLVLTYPLSTRSGLTEEEHLEAYRLIMDIFCENKLVHFKPHPDDKVNYSNYFEREPDFKLINKQILSELLEFETKTTYLKAITTVSTSTNNLQNTSQKIVFGKAFEDGYKKLLPYFGYYKFLEKLCRPEDYFLAASGLYTEMLCNIFQYEGDEPVPVKICDISPENENAAATVTAMAANKKKILLLSSAADLKQIRLEKDDIAIIENCSTVFLPEWKEHPSFRLTLKAEAPAKKQAFEFTALLPEHIKPFKGTVGALLHTGYTLTIE